MYVSPSGLLRKKEIKNKERKKNLGFIFNFEIWNVTAFGAVCSAISHNQRHSCYAAVFRSAGISNTAYSFTEAVFRSGFLGDQV